MKSDIDDVGRISTQYWLLSNLSARANTQIYFQLLYKPVRWAKTMLFCKTLDFKKSLLSARRFNDVAWFDVAAKSDNAVQESVRRIETAQHVLKFKRTVTPDTLP